MLEWSPTLEDAGGNVCKVATAQCGRLRSVAREGSDRRVAIVHVHIVLGREDGPRRDGEPELYSRQGCDRDNALYSTKNSRGLQAGDTACVRRVGQGQI